MWPFTLQLYVTSPSHVHATHYKSAFYIKHILLIVDRSECTQLKVINSHLVDDIVTQTVLHEHWMVLLIITLGISTTYRIYFVTVALCTIYTHTLKMWLQEYNYASFTYNIHVGTQNLCKIHCGYHFMSYTHSESLYTCSIIRMWRELFTSLTTLSLDHSGRHPVHFL